MYGRAGEWIIIIKTRPKLFLTYLGWYEANLGNHKRVHQIGVHNKADFYRVGGEGQQIRKSANWKQEFKKIKEIMTTKRLMRWCSVKMPEEN